MIEPELTFQQIKERVELPQLLAHYGYVRQQDEELGKGKWHVFEGPEQLIVFKGRGGDWLYFNSQDERDKGNVVDWMKNQVSTGRIAGLEQEPGRNLWQSVKDHFQSYLNLPQAERSRLPLPAIREIAPGEKFPSIHTKDCGPLANTTYLESRGIVKSTLENPQFAGRILTQLAAGASQAPVNTVFPQYCEGRIVGLEKASEQIKEPVAEKQLARALWLSKLPAGQAPAHLVVSDSALATISYAQLHPGEQALYASTAGSLTENQIFELKRQLKEEQILGVKAAFANDPRGHCCDTRLLVGFAGEHNPMKLVREHAHVLTVEVHTTSPANVQAINEQLKGFNRNLTEQYQQESGEPNSPATAQTLRNELISSARLGPNSYQFHVPVNVAALSSFNQAIVQNLQFSHKIELVKSKGRNWNEDVQQKQLGQQQAKAVQADPHALNLTRAGKPTLEQVDLLTQRQNPILSEAQARGERRLVVEFRESRDQISQLPTLRENLEKVGLIIDHGKSLPARELREVGMELTLCYRLDSPQLPAISQVLDALTTNTKVTVIEPVQDAAERRQLAAAQEQTQNQLRQASAQVQPSSSPLHDQARLSFIAVAGPLAKQLREAGAGLDAARLQELSKFLVKQPELRAIDKENLTKVLALVDKSPALSASPAVQQLRQAIQVLETPAVAPNPQMPQKLEPPALDARKRNARL
ncbi:hypothetical protein [Hymenobacter sp. YC55]|uniref:hypothetical protein n=1 Tax=Hymenobacter sp. YC55 TaxID=3034019 RepID=UPI0023F8E644|nr:hypothetical protein [Hymenobacter sp. YC55]MDF7813937.1 hypothetical protein [Hymenobacter sp. YC55]